MYSIVEAVAFVNRIVSRKQKEREDKQALLLQKTKEFPKVHNIYTVKY